METLLTESMISSFSSSGLLPGSFTGPAGNFRHNGTQLVLIEYHAPRCGVPGSGIASFLYRLDRSQNIHGRVKLRRTRPILEFVSDGSVACKCVINCYEGKIVESFYVP